MEKEITIPEAIAALEKPKGEPVVPAPVVESDKKVELVRCPRCSWDLKRLVMQAAEDDLKEYVRCILGCRPFTKTYTLFNGELTLKYSLLSSTESDQLADALAKLPRDNQMELATQAFRFKLLFYLRQFNNTTFKIPAVDADLDQEYKARFGAFGEDVPVLLIRNMIEFTKLAGILTESGFDRTFWKGAGLG